MNIQSSYQSARVKFLEDQNNTLTYFRNLAEVIDPARNSKFLELKIRLEEKANYGTLNKDEIEAVGAITALQVSCSRQLDRLLRAGTLFHKHFDEKGSLGKLVELQLIAFFSKFPVSIETIADARIKFVQLLVNRLLKNSAERKNGQVSEREVSK